MRLLYVCSVAWLLACNSAKITGGAAVDATAHTSIDATSSDAPSTSPIDAAHAVDSGNENDAGGSCGDGVCSAGETCATCDSDCCTASGPIEAQSGMTYSGLHITNPNGVCITLTNVSDVTIEDSEIGPCSTEGINAFGSSALTIQRNYIHDASTAVEIVSTTGGGIVVEHNYFLNVQGPYPRGEYVQFDTVSGAGNAVRCNVGEQDPLIGGTKEDSYSFYESTGTAESPIDASYNKARGGNSTTGCGMTLGDNDGQYITETHNIFDQTGDCGIGVASGQHIVMMDNEMYSPATQFSNVGMVIWNQYPSACSDITASGNQVNWTLGNSAVATPGTVNPVYNPGNCGTVAGYDTNNFAATIDDSIWDEVIAECQ